MIFEGPLSLESLSSIPPFHFLSQVKTSHSFSPDIFWIHVIWCCFIINMVRLAGGGYGLNLNHCVVVMMSFCRYPLMNTSRKLVVLSGIGAVQGNCLSPYLVNEELNILTRFNLFHVHNGWNKRVQVQHNLLISYRHSSLSFLNYKYINKHKRSWFKFSSMSCGRFLSVLDAWKMNSSHNQCLSDGVNGPLSCF